MVEGLNDLSAYFNTRKYDFAFVSFGLYLNFRYCPIYFKGCVKESGVERECRFPLNVYCCDILIVGLRLHLFKDLLSEVLAILFFFHFLMEEVLLLTDFLIHVPLGSHELLLTCFQIFSETLPLSRHSIQPFLVVLECLLVLSVQVPVDFLFEEFVGSADFDEAEDCVF